MESDYQADLIRLMALLNARSQQRARTKVVSLEEWKKKAGRLTQAKEAARKVSAGVRPTE